jgi:predicted phosphodiesterase
VALLRLAKSDMKNIIIPDDCQRIALCGGPYNNFSATEKFLAETISIENRFCLGDMGGFGPHPNRTIELMRDAGVVCVQGNYDDSVGNGEVDCGCGYIDPLDRKFAQISFDYTFKNTSEQNRAWLRELPKQIILQWRGNKILLCHGSPDEVNEFVWQSETDDARIAEWLEQYQVDGICATHSGIPWLRKIGKGFWLNVGVIGRPAHEGLPRVWYAAIDLVGDALEPTLIPMDYDSSPVVEAMRAEKLPEEFCQSLLSGTWTTCYNILPPSEQKITQRHSTESGSLTYKS